MRFYTGQHGFHCGIDLHAHTMAVCILDAAGEIAFERNLPTAPEAFLEAIAPYREGLVVACAAIEAKSAREERPSPGRGGLRPHRERTAS